MKNRKIKSIQKFGFISKFHHFMKILINRLVTYWFSCRQVELFIVMSCNPVTVFHLFLFNVLITYDSSLHNSRENCWFPLGSSR